MKILNKKIYEMTYVEGVVASLTMTAILCGICQGGYYIVKGVKKAIDKRGKIDDAYDVTEES